MTDKQIANIWILLIISVLLIIVPIVIWIVRRIIWTVNGARGKKSAQIARTLLAFSAMLLGAVWCVRFASEIYCFAIDTENLEGFSWWEAMFDTFLHSLQTFSLDENYDSCVFIGKLMMRELAGDSSPLVGLYGFYLTVLNVMAPIAGGAIIFDILSSIFPMLKLFFSYLTFWNTKYYFSELNDRALALAQSICETERTFFHRPVIIFTDAFNKKDEDKSAERLYKAKLLGAICVPDDIINLTKNYLGKRKYILINEQEVGNLHHLSGFASQGKYKDLKYAEVVLFSQDDMYILVEEQVREFLNTKLSEKEMPTILPVQRYRNLATNLFDDLPLFEPIIQKDKDENGMRDLNVTIIGAGSIGIEMVLAAYWYGQMLDVRLNINMVSRGSKERFFGALNHINPDIIKTATRGNELLRYNQRGDCAEPYCSINYVQADVSESHVSSFLESRTANGSMLYDTDYFVVCLGVDELNISVANQLSMAMGESHLKRGKERKTVISYVVFNSDLCKTLNERKPHDYSLDGGTDVYMYAFGSLNEMYSIRNIYMRDLELNDTDVDEEQISVKYNNQIIDIHKDRAINDYEYWSRLARKRHIKYKIFSSGLYTKSIFDGDFAEERKAAKEKYKSLIYGEHHDLDLMHRLAWLEHRRWCAFMRMRGFNYTDEYKRVEYYEKLKSHKNMTLKLHPCITESTVSGIKATFDSIGNIDKQLLFDEEWGDSLDRLDEVSLNVRMLVPGKPDFKRYDYPVEDFRDLKRSIVSNEE